MKRTPANKQKKERQRERERGRERGREREGEREKRERKTRSRPSAPEKVPAVPLSPKHSHLPIVVIVLLPSLVRHLLPVKLVLRLLRRRPELLGAELPGCEAGCESVDLFTFELGDGRAGFGREADVGFGTGFGRGGHGGRLLQDSWERRRRRRRRRRG